MVQATISQAHQGTAVRHLYGWATNASFAIRRTRVISKRNGAGSMERFIVSGVVWFATPRLSHTFSIPSRPYPKSKDAVFILGLVAGKGLAIVASETHHRQRKILNLAFSPAQLRISQIIFQQCSDKLVNGIKGSLAGGTDATVNIRDWMAKVTLDIIGLGNTLDGQRTELGTAMKHLFTASQTNTTALELILITLIRMLPNSMLGILQLFSTREIRQLVSVGNMAKRNAREILASHNDGQTPEGEGDIISVLERARSAGKMEDDEVEAQLMTFVIAGHETSSTSLCWLLYELAVHPEHQSIIRTELKKLNDYDSMPFLNAVIKEALRLYPVAHSLMRTAPHDDVPTSLWKEDSCGTQGTDICFLPSLWGDDAEEWNPARFLDKALPVSLGVYANLMSFSAGSRSCIGWRFAYVPSSFLSPGLFNLLDDIQDHGNANDPSQPDSSLSNSVYLKEVSRSCGFPGSPAVVPIVKGKAHLGSQLPLRVKVLAVIKDGGFRERDFSGF
ncbi:cytochrome P450 [Armillaria mellea]|nr:cytochrome P450 [Armillaria mellea]